MSQQREAITEPLAGLVNQGPDDALTGPSRLPLRAASRPALTALPKRPKAFIDAPDYRHSSQFSAERISEWGLTRSASSEMTGSASSEELWAKITGLDKGRAVDLVVAMATEAGTLVEQDAAEMLEGLRLLVTAYIEKPDRSGEVDRDWIVSQHDAGQDGVDGR